MEKIIPIHISNLLDYFLVYYRSEKDASFQQHFYELLSDVERLNGERYTVFL